jgi:NAD(P)-dependent dehydrogenase (short-subunit alcohol dehydrogenase family)
MKLKDKVAIITGGGGGIGRVVCLRFVREGAKLAIVDMDEEAAKEAVGLIEAEGGTALVKIADVTDSGAVDRAVAEIWDEFGTIDVLVNTAGIFRGAKVHEFPNDWWEQTIDVNLNGTMYCTRAVTKIWMERKMPGRVINFGSLSSYVAVEGSAAYCAAKAAVLLYTRVAGLELARYGINVNCVAPGPVDTPMLDQSVRTSPEREAEWLAKMPIGRFLQPEEIAGVVTFLASDDASSLVGECIACDGGYIIQ